MKLSHTFFWSKVLDLAGKQGLTQPSLAEKIEVPLPSLKDWIYKGRLPSLEVVTKIADYFNVSIDWLCGRTEISKEAMLIALKYDALGDREEIKRAILSLTDLT